MHKDVYYSVTYICLKPINNLNAQQVKNVSINWSIHLTECYVIIKMVFIKSRTGKREKLVT